MSAAAATLPRRLARRFVDDAAGFGLVELLIALMVMNVGIFATVAALNAGTLTLRRANTTANASVLAAKQMELYRALLYDNIAVLAPASPCDTTYCSDSKYAGSITSATCPPADPPEACQPITNVTGPDNNAYRVDTYLRLRTESAGLFPARAVKVITVVVRDARTKAALVRTESTFDRATAS